MPGEGGQSGGADPAGPALRVPAPVPVARHSIQRTLTFQVTGDRLGREIVRALLALFALGLVVTTVVLAYEATQGGHWSNAKDWLQAVLPAETGILGSVLGFYFGSHQSERRSGQ
jgi:hypothetical protein